MQPNIINLSEIKRIIFTGSAWVLAGKLLAALLGLVSNALLARLLSPAELGDYFIILSLVSVGAVIAQLGIERIIVRLLAQQIANYDGFGVRSVIRKALLVVVVMSFAIGVILVSLVGPIMSSQILSAPVSNSMFVVVTVWVTVFSIQSIIGEVFRGLEKIPQATIFGGLTSLVVVVGIFSGAYIAQGSLSLVTVASLVVASLLISNAIAIVALNARIRDYPKQDGYSVAKIIETAWPMLVTGLAMFVVTQANLWIIGIFRSQEEVALYGAAVRLLTVIALPLLVLNAVIPPIVAREHAKGNLKKLEVLLRGAATLVAIPAGFVLGGFIIAGETVLGSIFGAFYRDAGTVLSILGLGQAVNIWSGSCGIVLVMSGHQITMMAATLFTGILGALGAWLLIEPYGITGVAIVAAMSLAMQNIIVLMAVRRKLGLWTAMFILPPLSIFNK